MDNIGLSQESEPSYSKRICEAVNCSAKATMSIDVKVGKLGKILLSVCNDCCRKFQDSESEEGDRTLS
jgi:hypothetical protein